MYCSELNDTECRIQYLVHATCKYQRDVQQRIGLRDTLAKLKDAKSRDL